MYILSIDQSTSATKAIIFNDRAEIAGRKDIRHKQISPVSGWLEHDPEEIYLNTIAAIKSVVNSTAVDVNKIAAVSITNQRETTILWDAVTGKPIYNAIVWQCGRAEQILQEDKFCEASSDVKRKTGLTLSAYFSAAKACWILRNNKVPQGHGIMFGTMDSWLIWKLTHNHCTDYSNASRTQLMNLASLKWDEDLLKLFELSDLTMPAIRHSDEIYGMTTCEGAVNHPVPVTGVIGDSHGALFGQQCWTPGMGKSTFGTGSSVMVNIGYSPLVSPDGISTSVAWSLKDDMQFVFEGNITSTGDTMQWLKNNLGIIDDLKQSGPIASKLGSNQGIYFVPAFFGLGGPYYDNTARAVICGLFRDAGRENIIRAGLESIAYQIRDVCDLISRNTENGLQELRVDGGAADNDFLMQFTADILGINIVKNTVEELSALGSAYIAGLAVGIFHDKDDIRKIFRQGAVYQREMDAVTADMYYKGWKEAVKKARLS
jgi:glycerol kinase